MKTVSLPNPLLPPPTRPPARPPARRQGFVHSVTLALHSKLAHQTHMLHHLLEEVSGPWHGSCVGLIAVDVWLFIPTWHCACTWPASRAAPHPSRT